MNRIYQYGLAGQSDDDYDNLFCFGRKCKARRKERHSIRMDRRRAKNDARKAENERVRAETELLKQQQQKVTMPLTQQEIAPTNGIQPPNTPPPKQEGFGGNTMILLVVGGLALGGLALAKKGK